MVMLNDAAQSASEPIAVLDVAEIIADRLQSN